LFSIEGAYDWEFENYALSYHRSEERTHLPLHRYTAPRQQMVTAATGFNDRNMINQCLLYRYMVSYEPWNFKGRLSDFPDTVLYGQRLQALREQARAWIWDGTFRDTVGASVVNQASGAEHHPYTVFEDSDGTRAVCIANYDGDAVDLTVRADQDAPRRWYARMLDEDDWSIVGDGSVTLPGRSAAVLLPREPGDPRNLA
jgi:hypothetical protein